jgi:hypothetical protein
MLDSESSAQLAELVAKGAGGTLFLETDDCKAADGGGGGPMPAGGDHGRKSGRRSPAG